MCKSMVQFCSVYLKTEYHVKPYDNGIDYDEMMKCMHMYAGPGHGSVVVDAAGDWWLAYHRLASSSLN